MKCKLLRPMTCVENGEEVERPAGHVIDHPEAALLVRQGVAVPVDEECAARAGLSEEKLKAAQHAYERLSRGIHPDDFDIYKAGLMNGYDDRGRPTLNGKLVKPSAINRYRDEHAEEDVAEVEGIDPLAEEDVAGK